MTTALIGCTGFVGSNLQRKREYDVHVHSRNADEVRGRSFTHVVFTAARAEKWRANAEPEDDRAHIAELVHLLSSFRAERLTLISTVDVFADPNGVDERSRVDATAVHQYGRGRLALERAATDLHPSTAVVRLPALFGPGLKKNVLFDLLHGNLTDRVQTRSEFQYYPLSRLADDVDAVWRRGIPLVHLVTQPIVTADVIAEAFGGSALPERPEIPVVRYDVRTAHARDLGGGNRYLIDRARVMQQINEFVESSRRSL